MLNTNCLAGIACPKCYQNNVFDIITTSTFTVTDNGTESHDDVEWDEKSHITCRSCWHSGTIEEFSNSTARIMTLPSVRKNLAQGERNLREEISCRNKDENLDIAIDGYICALADTIGDEAHLDLDDQDDLEFTDVRDAVYGYLKDVYRKALS